AASVILVVRFIEETSSIGVGPTIGRAESSVRRAPLRIQARELVRVAERSTDSEFDLLDEVHVRVHFLHQSLEGVRHDVVPVRQALHVAHDLVERRALIIPGPRRSLTGKIQRYFDRAGPTSRPPRTVVEDEQPILSEDVEAVLVVPGRAVTREITALA